MKVKFKDVENQYIECKKLSYGEKVQLIGPEIYVPLRCPDGYYILRNPDQDSKIDFYSVQIRSEIIYRIQEYSDYEDFINFIGDNKKIKLK